MNVLLLKFRPREFPQSLLKLSNLLYRHTHLSSSISHKEVCNTYYTYVIFLSCRPQEAADLLSEVNQLMCLQHSLKQHGCVLWEHHTQD